MNNRIHCAARLRSLLLSSFLLLSLFVVGCPPAETVQPGRDGGDGTEQPEDDAGTPVVEDELTAAMEAIEDGNLDSTFVLDSQGTLNPGGRVVVYLWEVEVVDGADDCGAGIDDPTAPVAVFTPSCRGVHHVTLTVSFVDDSKSSKALESFSVDNRLPVLSGLAPEAAFLPGAEVSISASVEDDDDDPTTCRAYLADDNEGDPAGLGIPEEPSADCSFTITTPLRVDTWKVEVIASDGIGDSLPMTIELRAGNEPPVITDLSTDPTEVGYTCVDDACTAATVRVTVVATDDSDAFEDLAITLASATGAPVPDGVVVTSTPVAETHGAFDVVVSRPDLGQIADTYTLTATVTEVTADGAPTSATQDISFDVVSALPVIDSITAPDVPHAYAANTYTATLTVAATTSDPEGNALTTTVELLSCPKAAAGQAACGGADLTITETATDGQLEVDLSTANLGNLAGEYVFRVTATDADGEFGVEDVSVNVLNTAPSLATGFTSPVEQHYVGGAHQASTPLFSDLEGDPITATLSVTCPDGSNPSLPGDCDSGQSVSVSAGALQVRGPATGLLGDYVVTGTLTDGAASLNLNATFAVENTGPTMTSSAGFKTCHHTTSGTVVTNESGCSFPFSGTAIDPNDDPLTYTVALTTPNGYTRTGSAYVDAPVPSNGNISFSSGLQTTYANFKATFADQTQRITVTVLDPFGSGVGATIAPQLNNRAPTVASKIFRNTAGTGAPPALPNDELDKGSRRARNAYNYACLPPPGSCSSHPGPYRFALDVEGDDPDGDPLQTSLSVSCSDTVTDASGAPLSQFRTLPASGLVQMEILGDLTQCGGIEWYQEWRVTALNDPFLCPINDPLNQCTYKIYKMRCTLSGASSKISDGIEESTFGTSTSFSASLAEEAAGFSCTN